MVSAETAAAMAKAVRGQLETDFGVAITGVAGPDPQGGVQPGTVHVAVAPPEGEASTLSMSMNQGRAAVKRRAVTTALMLLRRTLLAQD